MVVSYYAHPKLDDLYPVRKWTMVHCPTTKSLVNAGKQDANAPAKIAPEVLLINGPSYTQQNTLFGSEATV